MAASFTPVRDRDEDDDGHGSLRDGLTRTTRLALASRHVERRPRGRLPLPPLPSINASLAPAELTWNRDSSHRHRARST
jgi:hypothetical protein